MQCPLTSESLLSRNVDDVLAGRFRTHKWPLMKPFGQRAPRRELLAMRPGWRIVAQAQTAPQVVLTREKGKNKALAKMLTDKQISWLELPLVEAANGPERDRLPAVLSEQQFAWIVITSPEAASVFLQAWNSASQPQVRIAVVGEGTARIIEAANSPDRLNVAFKPTKADAVHLSAELPLEPGTENLILYPASVKAPSTLQAGLEKRGCQVLRLNTYDTVPARSLAEEDLQLASAAEVLTVASPSAMSAWQHHSQNDDLDNRKVACIGSTSAKAAKKLGYKNVYSTDTPGLHGFLEAIEEALAAS